MTSWFFNYDQGKSPDPKEFTVKTFLMSILLATALTIAACTPAGSGGEEKLEVADKMVQAWNEINLDGVIDLFSEDATFQSMMLEPMVGREVIRERWGPMFAGLEKLELQIRNRGVIGDVVVLERIDVFDYNGKHGEVPVVAVLEIADGKVTEWREYYDHKSLVASMTPDPKSHEELEAEASSEILALTKKLEVDWNGGGMDAYLAAYQNDESISLVFGDKAVRGMQGMSDLFKGSWTTEEEMGDFHTNNVVVRLSSPDIAIASGGFEHVFPNLTVVGSFTHVWRRIDDGWLIIHEHTSRANPE
jgi:limonene-1,2-epoxide hydrolase